MIIVIRSVKERIIVGIIKIKFDIGVWDGFVVEGVI